MSDKGRSISLADLINLKGKSAVVTGGASGIGFAIVYRLAEAGACVVIADIEPDASQALETLKEHGLAAEYVQCDVTSEDAVRALIDGAAARYGGIDILINNAGIFPHLYLEQTSLSDFQRVIAVNLAGTFLCSKEASRHMIEQKRGGCIINLASIDAVHPSASGMTAYDASKGGVLTLTKSLAKELGKHAIRVNAIAPGGIVTAGVKMQTRGSGGKEGKAQLKAFLAHMALGRMGRPDEVARIALFLASDLASYMTGSMVTVDGGYLIS